jgi:Sigma-70 region 2
MQLIGSALTGFTLGTSSEFSGRRIAITDAASTMTNRGVVMLAITEVSKEVIASRPAAECGSAQDRSDQALIRTIAGGDRRAMQVLYARHHVRVYRFVLRLTNDASLAEDLVSEVFLGVWRHAGGFEGKSQVATWMLSIARHKAFSALKRRPHEQLSDKLHVPRTRGNWP